MEKLGDFVEQVIGKKYNIGPRKLLKRASMKMDSLEDNRTFFCSELVAKTYKMLGLIPDAKKSCSRYYPSSFA